MKRYYFTLILLAIHYLAWSQECDPVFDEPYSPRIANYDIQVKLDNERKMIQAQEQLMWYNSQPDTVSELRFHLYLNAFKNMQSTFLNETGGSIFGDNFAKEGEERWGWIEVNHIKTESGEDLRPKSKYIQPNDQNPVDQTVLQVPLPEPLAPGDTVRLDLDFTAKLPKVFVRVGYSKDDYYLFVQWFPKVGVYEPCRQGEGSCWNSHQYMRRTEYFADFGVYNVEMTIPDHLTIGSTGCRVKEVNNDDGTITYGYQAEDVFDFAWTLSPRFIRIDEQWNHVGIKLMIQPEHKMLADRHLFAVRSALEYLDEHVGPYVYPTITVVDPPVHGLRSGLMEYPTLITCGSFYRIPESIRTVESLVIHEFAHQYFMGMLASNEKEEAWLDEGFVTYLEDRIMDHTYGSKRATYSIFGFRTGSEEMSRLEYTGMSNPAVGAVARPSWEVTESYKELIYSKTATSLHTLENMLGTPLMDKMLQTYYQRHRFTHPRGEDFVRLANEVVMAEQGYDYPEGLDWYFDQVIYGTAVCDYSVARISNLSLQEDHGFFDTENGEKEFRQGDFTDQYLAKVTVHRLGDMIIPTTILVRFDDGSERRVSWDGQARSKTFEFRSGKKVVMAHVDPEYKITLDVNINNNSKTLRPDKRPIWKYAAKALFWVQNIMHTAAILG